MEMMRWHAHEGPISDIVWHPETNLVWTTANDRKLKVMILPHIGMV